MAPTYYLFGIICFSFAGGFFQPYGNLLDKRAEVIRIAQKEIGVRERTGHNDGTRVETYLAAADLKKGAPWCAAYITWVFKQAGMDKPHTGWSPDMFPHARLARSALPGNLLGIYFPELKRIAHVGLIVSRKSDWIISVEGNTNVDGSREGDGVYAKRRHIKTIYRMADWITPLTAEP